MVIIVKNNFNIGRRIREIRQQQALSQEQLALRAGITTAYLGMVERGEKNPTVAVIERICHAANLSLPDFFASHRIENIETDEISQQILCQLAGRTTEEKALILQIIKQIFRIQRMGNTPKT